MTNQEILTKAIEKAIAGGFVPIDVPTFEPEYFKIKRPGKGDLGWPWYLIRWMDAETGVDTEVNVEHVIFSHDFAKALWGELEAGEPREGWQYHLQHMVIADDPIAYLGANI